jgi:hypothetical protein
VGIKSLVITAVLDQAINAHNCQANAKHRIHGGEPRLKVRAGMGSDYYCRACAQKIVQRDLEKLQQLSRSLAEALPN